MGALGWLMVVAGTLVLLFVAWTIVKARAAEAQDHELAAAKQTFHQRREWLEAKFMTLAGQSGKPRGLAWVDCDFEDEVSLARDRQTGQLRALVGVTIRFRAVEGGGMEDNPNAANLRAATAVFRLDNVHWETDGRAIFNLNPAETLQHFQHELELAE